MPRGLGEFVEQSRMEKKTWIAHYIYAADDGSARTRIRKILAADYDAAVQLAANDSPGEEFVVSVYPESDDQYLGLVRGAAMRMSGRGSGD
ncbi:MAG: hypothetical protein OEZ03_10650 [Alphaproteobacteria bacterium]|nr:hypothetical protein [Alphaproteobacteria bacterium]